MKPTGATSAQKATITAVIRSPASHMSMQPPAIVVLACRPTTVSPIIGVRFAIRSTISVVTESASGLSKPSTTPTRSTWPQRTQAARAPGGGSGTCCSRSQSGQASMVTLGSPSAARIAQATWRFPV